MIKDDSRWEAMMTYEELIEATQETLYEEMPKLALEAGLRTILTTLANGENVELGGVAEIRATDSDD